jgi:phage gp16-like protein
MLTNKQKALIHVAKQRLGMTEPEYRALLSSYGAESCTQLRQGQFDSLMRRLGELGFTAQGFRKKTRRIKRAAKPASVPKSRELLRAKVRERMAELGLRDGYVDAMARHMFGVDAWAWLDAEGLYKLVAALTYHQRRRERRREHG